MTYPTAIVRAAWDMALSGELQAAIIATMGPFLLGMAISIVAGIAIGLLIGQFRLAEYILDPFLDALYSLPRVALVPLIMLWFGLGLGGKVIIVVSIAMFPIIVNTYAGVRDVRGSLLDIGRAYAASEVADLLEDRSARGTALRHGRNPSLDRAGCHRHHRR